MISPSGIYLKVAHFTVKTRLMGGGVFLEPYNKPFWDMFGICLFSGQNRVNWGTGFLFCFFISGIIYIQSPCKISEPNNQPFWEKSNNGFLERNNGFLKSNNGRDREKKEILVLIVDT